ncbi:uncharacterized protein B0H18DRAFT_992960 [Fomitopsis serialis]|uniref:uncharacterized protein n=1 Tax=Fomitopsis serialis TaxID=139415 RepID=UPI002008881E|nr:uncharacterized protein B0H18DRAFT_992960 [Neoantrodia serialis]KAH9930668.1 hypothetical protein B0H18DRAFT_992960 [Neoantrodia serialis]
MALRAASVTRAPLGLRAIFRHVPDAGAVVAPTALHAIPRQMANSSTSVAGFVRSTTGECTRASPGSGARLGTRTRDVADLTAAVAFLATTVTSAGRSGHRLGAVPRLEARMSKRKANVAAHSPGALPCRTCSKPLVLPHPCSRGRHGPRRRLNRLSREDCPRKIGHTVIASRRARLWAARGLVAKSSAVKATPRTGHGSYKFLGEKRGTGERGERSGEEACAEGF